MYDLVYYAEGSRIAEKMLEKAVLICKDEPSIKKMFTIDGFLELDDEKLLWLIEGARAEVKHLLAARDPNRLYRRLYQVELNSKSFAMNEDFLTMLERDHDQLAENLSLHLNGSLDDRYKLICDIVRSKVPREIFLDEFDERGQEVELSVRSSIVRAISPVNVLKVYAEPSVLNTYKQQDIEKKLKELVEGELSFG